ncbi:hypothetical protein CHU32_01130 [Superficieibacter electus]|uniref:DUF7916 domain-containing protein n=1 Tax=Superficieibacter electus TaxID=2022662 RepID=A0A2P5GW60_9ENTR|nr:hypothetical protein [Superficieibacter electus]POP47774.1 hypothetical protein CHU33_01125 [Superficieibacter electus]POP50787.1 hypothetical protein CHU32_01130 [Superficieibacter electus]
MQRILNCRTSDFAQSVSGSELRQAIVACEGRTIMAEVAAGAAPLYGEVTNGELLCAFGADLLLVKGMDCHSQSIQGCRDLKHFKALTGRMVGVSLEVLADEATDNPRACNLANLDRITGADFLCLTAYDKPGVTAQRVCEAVQQMRAQTSKLILVAKFYAAGLACAEEYAGYITAGADGVMVPAPASCRGASETRVDAALAAIRQAGGLAITTISSSQEGADEETIRQIGLASKRCGADLYNFGDAGVAGMADPQAVYTLSLAVRGRRHTWVRMAASLAR